MIPTHKPIRCHNPEYHNMNLRTVSHPEGEAGIFLRNVGTCLSGIWYHNLEDCNINFHLQENLKLHIQKIQYNVNPFKQNLVLIRRKRQS
jgi:hypothetical protein